MESESSLAETSSAACSSFSAKNRLKVCEVCAINDAKYSCPRCEVKTCSLKCTQIHKKELDCDGERDRTKFIPVNRFTNIDLSSDYRLLEEISRNIVGYKKNLSKPPLKFPALPYYLMKLKRVAQSRKTTLKFLPRNFVRRRQNTSCLSKNSIIWRIEWVFASENLKLWDENVPEDSKLGAVLQKYFTKQEDGVVQDKLRYYQSAGLNNIKLFLKAEEVSGNKFYELDLDESLKDNLRSKTVIEYPIIHVVLKSHGDCYEIASSDANTATQLGGMDVVNHIIKRAESDETIYKSMKNLLFSSENLSSDSDDDK